MFYGCIAVFTYDHYQLITPFTLVILLIIYHEQGATELTKLS